LLKTKHLPFNKIEKKKKENEKKKKDVKKYDYYMQSLK